MNGFEGISPINQLLRATALELNACQNCVDRNVLSGAVDEDVSEEQAIMLTHLLDSLSQVEKSLKVEIDAGRFEKIDPEVLDEIHFALHDTINDPLDAKVKAVYVSVFGYNTSLWHMLRNIQKLLRTVHVPDKEQLAGKRVMKVQKKNKELRKRRDE